MKKGAFFIIIGVLLLLGALGYAAHNFYQDRKSSEAADEAVEALAAEIYGAQESEWGNDKNETGTAQKTAEAAEQADASADAADAAGGNVAEDNVEAEDTDKALWELYPEMEMPTITVSGYRYIGILEIPSRSLKLPVMEEWDYTRLNVAPCRYSGSAYQDNMVICGHNYSGHFSEVRYISVGESVIFTDVDGNVFNYIVDNVETLQPAQVDDMITGDWDLTLFTCNTGARTRRAVRCYRVKE